MIEFDLEGHDYLDRAVDNLLYGLANFRDENGLPFADTVQKYLAPLPTTPTWIALMPGGQRPDDEAGEPFENQIFTVIIRWVLGKTGDGFDGDLPGRIWVMLPIMVNYINAYPTLVFDEENQDDIPELSPKGARCTGMTRQGTFRDDPEHVGIEVTVEIPFAIENEEFW